MKLDKLINQIDRWGTILLIYLLPWQARIIFSQGFLAGVPSEPQTRSLFAVEILVAVMLAVRFVAMRIEKDVVSRNRYGAVKSIDRVLFALGLLVCLSFLSVIISGDRMTTFFSTLRIAEGMAVFFLIVTAPSEWEARLVFLISALVQSSIAVMQTAFQNVYPSTWLGMAAHYPGVSGTSVVESSGLRFLRAYGTLPHPNILGGMIAIAMLGSRSLFKRFSIYNVAVYFLLTVGLFFSFSRLAVLAVIAGLVAQGLWARRDKVFLKSIGVVIVTGIVLSALLSPLVLSRTVASGRLESKSIATRVSTFKDAASLILSHPFSGVGTGAFTWSVKKEVDPKRGGYEIEPAHSIFVLVFAELGFFAFLLFVLLISFLTIAAWRSGKIGLAVTLIFLACFDHWGWSTYAGILIFWVGWGFTMRGCSYKGLIQKAGAIILSEREPHKILILYRTGPNYNDWTLPKGHMEPGESREDTARREAKEETGLDIKLVSALPDRDYVTGHGHGAVVHFFLARSKDDSLLRLEPGFPDNRLEWIEIEKAADILTFDNMKEYFRRILPDVLKEAKRHPKN